MASFSGQPRVRILIWGLAVFVWSGGLLGLGYWLGQRSLPPHLNNLAAFNANTRATPVNPWTRPNGMNPFPQQAGPNLPANASPEMKEFMQNRMILLRKIAELRQQNPTSDPNGRPDPKVIAEFQQQNADLLKRQKELAQIIGQQEAKNPIPTPPPLQIPPGASPQLQAFLTDRDQLMRDQIAFMNQHRTEDPQTRMAAMQQWRQENASRFAQLQQLGQALTPAHASAQPPKSN